MNYSSLLVTCHKYHLFVRVSNWAINLIVSSIVQEKEQAANPSGAIYINYFVWYPLLVLIWEHELHNNGMKD